MQLQKAINIICINTCFYQFFFSFQPFPSVRGGQSISSSSKPFYLQHPSPSLPTSPISSFTTSKNLLFGLPLLFPGYSISIIFLPTYSWSLLMTCPYHLSLPSLIFIPNRSTLTILRMYLFVILSFLVFLFFCERHRLNFIDHCTKQYTFPFTLAGNLLSQITFASSVLGSLLFSSFISFLKYSFHLFDTVSKFTITFHFFFITLFIFIFIFYNSLMLYIFPCSVFLPSLFCPTHQVTCPCLPESWSPLV